MMKHANSDINLKNIIISDKFWNKYIKLVKEVIIPYQWDILNDRIENIETSDYTWKIQITELFMTFFSLLSMSFSLLWFNFR